MTRVRGIVSGIAALVVCAISVPASAQSFGGLLEKAQSIDSGKAMAALFWSQTADCSKASGDVAKRQCKGVLEGRKQQLRDATFEVAGEAGSVVPGEYNDKSKSLRLDVAACVACAQPLDVGGSKVYVVASEGPVAGDAGRLVPSKFHGVDVKVKNQPDSARFLRDVVPRLRTQLIIKPAEAKPFKVGGLSGYRVKLVGFRVYDPCDGKVYAANPPSSSLAPDDKACTGESIKQPEKEPEAPVAKKPELPRQLTPAQIRDALEPARQAARKCYEAYGVPGTARFRITIAGSGEVIGMRETGDFQGTPTSKCIRQAVKATTFPKTRRARTNIDYPFILR